MKRKKRVVAKAASARRSSGSEAGPRDARGRVHLALFRDPTSGAEQVALRAPLFREEWQNQLVAGAASTARAATAGAPTRETTAALARGVMDSVSRLLAGLLARAPAGAIACKAGCDHCCYQAVSVTLPEALAIFEHLEATATPDDRAALRAHLADRHAATRELSAAERFSPEHPCPFLDASDGRCRVYEVRPLSCRGMNSLDADECARRLRDPEARRAFVAGGESGHLFREPIAAVQAVSAGLQLALAELEGLDMRPLELTHVLHLLFEGGAEQVLAWLAGGSPFEAAARRADDQFDPRLRRLAGALEPDDAR